MEPLVGGLVLAEAAVVDEVADQGVMQDEELEQPPVQFEVLLVW